MNMKRLGWPWKFTGEITEDTEIQCQYCNAWSAFKEWGPTSVECETCGDHDALECPHCFEGQDHIHQRPFETRNPPI